MYAGGFGAAKNLRGGTAVDGSRESPRARPY